MEKIESVLDPESEFIASKRETGNEWELFKENVRPLKRGRNIHLLNDALKSHTQNHLKTCLLQQRRRMIEAIDEYEGDDPLQPWLECIKWVQEAFPPGGDCSGLVVIYEQCVRSFWHDTRYKDDVRYLKVWLEYAENCADSEVVYNFLEANCIGQTHTALYISHALHLESKNKIKTANDIFTTGISRNAQPIEKLKAAYKKFLSRSLARKKPTDEEAVDNHLPGRSFGTILARGESRNLTSDNSDISRKKLKQERTHRNPLSIYKDTNSGIALGHQSELPMSDSKSWQSLAARAERNKENNSIPSKWTSNKITQRSGHRIGVGAPASAACIEIYVDEDCSNVNKTGNESGNNSITLKIRHGDGRDIKRETELLRENPLRNFPPNCLPR